MVDAREIGMRYMKDWFSVDLLSTVPVDKLVRIGRGGGSVPRTIGRRVDMYRNIFQALHSYVERLVRRSVRHVHCPKINER